MRGSVTIFLLICASGSYSAFGQGCCTGGVPLTGSYSVTNLSESQWTLAFTYDDHWMKALFIGGDKLTDPTVQRNSKSLLAQVGYGITNRLNVALLLSHIWQKEETVNTPSYSKFSSSGLGDAQLSLQYTLISGIKLQWVAGSGIILPLADTQQSQDDFVLPPSLQPGLGAVGGMVYTNVAYSPEFRPQLVLSNALFFRFNGESDRFANVESYRFGSIFQWFITATDQFVLGTTLHYPGISLQVKKQQFDQINAEKNDNTGGTWWFLMPSYKIAWTPAISNFFQAELPIHRKVNGFQITTSYRITIGLNFVL